MKIHVTGDILPIAAGLELLADQLDIQLHDEGYPIKVSQRAGPISISNNDGKGQIGFQEKIHFFRAIGLWLEEYQKKGEFSLSEQPQFHTSGVMLDVSRNAVLKVEEVQGLLRYMAIMGLNVAMLYTEDTYEIPDYPYFGYMRGRYTEEELRQCDKYADLLGIEMIPCIQTLGHLAMALKWGYAQEIRDTNDILLAGDPKTYQFIESMMTAASRPFKSKRIHVGMDEAHQLGLGHFLKQNGYKNRFDIMNQHLQEVVSIADRLSLSPMIWSDMYFRLGSKEGEYYDPDVSIPKDAAESIPANVQLVYWDYYHSDEEFYRSFIRKHTELGRNTVFAGGAWTWNGIAPNYGRAFKTTEAALAACKKEGIKEIFTTLWGDNGAETPLTTALPVMQLFAEHTYNRTVDLKKLDERFLFCAGSHLEDFLFLNRFDETPGVMKDNLYSSNASKFLLWQDVMIGLFDENIRGLEMNEHFKHLVPKLKAAKERNPKFSGLFGYYEQLAVLLSSKAEIGIKIKAAYDQGDKNAMAGLIETIQQLAKDAQALHILHRDIWFSLNKPFGWEIVELRYGGLEARLKTALFRIEQWVNGKVYKLEELEANRLKHDGPNGIPEGSLGNHFYHRIVTAGSMM